MSDAQWRDRIARLADLVPLAPGTFDDETQQAAADVRAEVSMDRPRKLKQYGNFLVACVNSDLRMPFAALGEVLARAEEMAVRKKEGPALVAEEPRSLLEARPDAEETGAALADVPTAPRIVKGLVREQAGRHLGDLVGWSLLGLQASIEIKECQRLAAEHGISADLEKCWPRITASGAYRQAVHHLMTRQATDERDVEAVRVEEQADRVVHEIVERRVDASGAGDALSANEARFTRAVRVAWDKNAHEVRADDPTNPIALQVVTWQKHFEDHYTAQDVRVAFQRAMERRWGGCPLLPHGGIFYVPADFADKVRAWAAFMRDIGCSPLIIPLFDTSESVASLRAAAEESLEAQLQQLKAEVERFAGKDDSKVSTLEARVERFDEIRAKADLYERVLGATVADLRAEVEAARLALVAHVDTAAAAAEARRAEARKARRGKRQ